MKGTISVIDNNVIYLIKQLADYECGLNDREIDLIENLYAIRFPKALKDFLHQGTAISDNDGGFPDWRNLSLDNVESIKKRINAPYNWLKRDVLKYGYWSKSWGKRPENPAAVQSKFMSISENAPLLIPIYSHRYMPVLDGVDDPPIISTVGRDTVYYGHNLEEYLEAEFLKKRVTTSNYTYIPFWSEIIGDKI